ncbi:MAG: hypothetical protein PF574_02245 [Candidatus Delongbacteria bacterium]|jgi:hypothetical protein|nr:hypothetical protein [Candidatus Delongbacteria bacterium]
MKRLLITIISVFILGCGSKYVNVETQRFNVKVKQLYKQDGVIVVYYLKDAFKGDKLTDKEDNIEISEESSIHEPILIITEKASVNELRGTKNVLEKKYDLVLPTGYEIKEKE